MKTLILGANGMLGHSLQDVFPEATGWDIDDVDITNAAATAAKIKTLKPRLIINSAAFTDVDACEDKRELCFKVNGYALETLAKVAEEINAVLVHFSTDYVFDGANSNGYDEDDCPNPISVYGESKALGEQLLLKNTSRYFLVRTSWLYGKYGKNFVDTILRLATEKDKLEVVNDQFGSPTYTNDLARKVKELAATADFGIYHVTNSGVTSWFDFAKRILELKQTAVPIIPITSSQLTRKAKRPEFSILLNNKTSSLRHWELALKEYLGVG